MEAIIMACFGVSELSIWPVDALFELVTFTRFLLLVCYELLACTPDFDKDLPP